MTDQPYKEHKVCRICGCTDLTPYLDLGKLPLSNNLCNAPDEVAPVYPLVVALCSDCGLSQLTVVVDPKLLYSYYTYRSDTSKPYLDHCNKMALDLKERYNLTSNIFHIDIAGNDGALALEFKKVLGNSMSLNVDPAENLAPICEAKGIRAFTAFWGAEAAKHLQRTDWPKADLITATNVIAHVDSIREFMQAVKDMLAPDGVCIIEAPYLIDFIENGEFDTVYFEHLSYMSVFPMYVLCEEIGLTLQKVEHQDIHGGSMRYHIGFNENACRSVVTQIAKERKYWGIETYKKFRSKANNTIEDFKWSLIRIKKMGYKIAGFAASAKGNTLLNCAGITKDDMLYIVDQTKKKIGKYSPGTQIPIVDIDVLVSDPPDYLVILAWNFQDVIIEKCRALGYKGRYIIGIPEFCILD